MSSRQENSCRKISQRQNVENIFQMNLQEGYRTFTSRGTERYSELFWLVTNSRRLDVFNTNQR